MPEKPCGHAKPCCHACLSVRISHCSDPIHCGNVDWRHEEGCWSSEQAVVSTEQEA